MRNSQNSNNKETTLDRGNWGEQVAADYLISLGCAIRERKWKGRSFEVDIIAQKGTRVIFVEVKTRKPDGVDPVDAVNATQRAHLIHAADLYLRHIDLPLDYQFDIIAITGNAHDYKLTHYPDAFFPSPRAKR